VIFLAELH